MRAYLAEGVPAAKAAARFGYTLAGFTSLVRDFRVGKLEFFPTIRPGPRRAPAKDAAYARVIELRLAGHSIDEISAALAAEGSPLNRTGVWEILAAEGLPRLWRRPHHERGGVLREQLPRAKVLDFAELAATSPTRVAGLLLAVPDLVALDLPGLVRKAGYPAPVRSRRSARSLGCWPSSSPPPGGSPTSRTWPPTRVPPCSPAWPHCRRKAGLLN